MTPEPTARRPRVLRVTTSIQSCFARYSARICGVLSVEPSSTITHLVGWIDWLMTEPSVSRIYFASSRHGEISKYLQWLDLARSTPVAVTTGGQGATVLSVFSRAAMPKNKLSHRDFSLVSR